jgi:DNA-binding CsgD family transcriptional regulator/GAF domain-containing protein
VASVEREEWCDGPPLGSDALAERVLALWRAAAEISGDDSTAVEPPRDVVSAQAMLDESGGWLTDVLENGMPPQAVDRAGPGAASLMLEHARLYADVRDVSATRRLRGFAAVSAALARMRRIESVDQMMDRAPAELALCGYDRVMFTRIDGSVGTPTAVHVDGDPQWAREILRVGRAQPLHITHLLLESEMLRRRGPVLVRDARNDPRVHAELVAVTGTRSYVAAPVMPQGHVIGLLHADCYIQRRSVDEVDRDLLWMFAEGFGHAYERATLLTRLSSLRQEVRRANSSILAVMDEFCEADVEVARVEGGDQGVARSAAAMFVTADNRLESLLTPRELDVIRLMAGGDTNAGIAAKLVVSEGTVKSHVKHILRKLRASNRAEAVSRYIRLTQQHGTPQR